MFQHETINACIMMYASLISSALLGHPRIYTLMSENGPPKRISDAAAYAELKMTFTPMTHPTFTKGEKMLMQCSIHVVFMPPSFPTMEKCPKTETHFVTRQ